MYRKIAVFVGEICREFQSSFASHFATVANNADYDVFFFCNSGSYTGNPLFEIGERDILEIPDYTQFDAVVSLSDTFDIDGMEERLITKIESANPDCPIITIRNGPLGTYRVLIDDFNTTYQITQHFLKEHKFTRLCYLSGDRDVPDAKTRQDAFLKAMSEAGLEVNDLMTYEGDYWYTPGEAAVTQFLQAFREEGSNKYLYPEAIICGNDYMAISVCNALRKRGIQIPGDICVFGFDEIIDGIAYDPQLSTVSMPTKAMASKALEIILKLHQGQEIPHDYFLSGDIKLKGSCEYNLPKAHFDAAALVTELMESSISIKQASQIFIDLQNHISADEKLAFLESYFYKTKCKRGYVCLCTEQKNIDIISPYSDSIILRDIFPYKDISINKTLLGTAFNRSEILPREAYLDNSTPSCFFVMPIHFKDVAYGYYVMEPGEEMFDYFVTALTTALAYTYEDLTLMKRFDQLEDIRRQSLIDPLTGVGNRRSFDQYLTMISQRLNSEGGYLSIVMADLDNLKFVNDSYGHEEGDRVIREFAQILKGLTDNDDLCARVGGDEFACVLYSKDKDKHDSFVERAYDAVSLRSSELDLPYIFHASFGCCSHNEYIGTSLLTCMKLADERMYFAKSEFKKSLLASS